jgi:hypothetical protein
MREVLVSASACDDLVRHASVHAEGAQEHAQGLRVGCRSIGAVPLVDPPVGARRLVAEPELGAEPGEAGEQRGVGDRLGPEQPVGRRARPSARRRNRTTSRAGSRTGASRAVSRNTRDVVPSSNRRRSPTCTRGHVSRCRASSRTTCTADPAKRRQTSGRLGAVLPCTPVSVPMISTVRFLVGLPGHAGVGRDQRAYPSSVAAAPPASVRSRTRVRGSRTPTRDARDADHPRVCRGRHRAARRATRRARRGPRRESDLWPWGRKKAAVPASARAM